MILEYSLAIIGLVLIAAIIYTVYVAISEGQRMMDEEDLF